MDKIKLFCFPYAGGSSVVYQQWNRFINGNIELVPVELAGRGRRINDPMYTTVEEAVDDIYGRIEHQLQGPYAFFGHSMGAMLSYELTHKIVKSGTRMPEQVFFSGRSAPHVMKEDDKKYHLMENDVFRKEVLELGGTPPEFFEHPELMELFIPLLKNDFRLAETDLYDGRIDPLPIDINVFLGKDDDLTSDQCEGWKMHTTQSCNIHYFEGGHFFLNDETKGVVDLINGILGQGYHQEISL